MAKQSEGYYKATVSKWEIVVGGKNQDKLFWQLTFELTEQVADRGSLSDEGIKLDKPITRTIRRVLSRDNVDWILGDVRQLGFEGKDLRRLDPDAKDAFDFGGKRFIARCIYKEYEGKDFEEWRIERQVIKADKALVSSVIAEMEAALAGDDNIPF